MMNFVKSLFGGSQVEEQTNADPSNSALAALQSKLSAQGLLSQTYTGNNPQNAIGGVYQGYGNQLGTSLFPGIGTWAYTVPRARSSYGRSISRSRNRYCTRSGSY